MILLLDNYDSFVFNLDRYFQQLGHETLVVRSDAIGVDTIERTEFDAIVISPGPKSPDQAGCSLEVVRRMHRRTPILGVCLGHQCIAQAFGATIIRSSVPMHGRASSIRHDQQGIFEGIPSPCSVARYHSLIACSSSFPDTLEIQANCDDRLIMAFRHRQYPVFGLQFHPESVLTEYGYRMLANFLKHAGLASSTVAPGPGADVKQNWSEFQ